MASPNSGAVEELDNNTSTSTDTGSSSTSSFSISCTTTTSTTSIGPFQADKVNEKNIDFVTEEELVNRLITLATQEDEDEEDECSDASHGEYQSASEGEADEVTTDIRVSLSDDQKQTQHDPGQASQLSVHCAETQTQRSSGETGGNASSLTSTDHDKTEGQTDDANIDSKLFDASSDLGASGDGLTTDNIETKKDTGSVTEQDKEKLEEVARLEKENTLTEEERQVMLSEAVDVKNEGNAAFKNGHFKEALELYSRALELCPLKYIKQRAIMLSNRAACYVKEENYEEVVKDCTKAIDCDLTYIKAISRRADAYEHLEKLDEALKDHRMIVELDRSQAASFYACMRLEKQIEERNEKLKTEMLGKLKELGNMVLRPFGLSTNNFQINQDPATGSYSCQFVQNQPSNGK